MLTPLGLLLFKISRRWSHIFAHDFCWYKDEQGWSVDMENLEIYIWRNELEVFWHGWNLSSVRDVLDLTNELLPIFVIIRKSSNKRECDSLSVYNDKIYTVAYVKYQYNDIQTRSFSNPLIASWKIFNWHASLQGVVFKRLCLRIHVFYFNWTFIW